MFGYRCRHFFMHAWKLAKAVKLLEILRLEETHTINLGKGGHKEMTRTQFPRLFPASFEQKTSKIFSPLWAIFSSANVFLNHFRSFSTETFSQTFSFAGDCHNFCVEIYWIALTLFWLHFMFLTTYIQQILPWHISHLLYSLRLLFF